VFLWDLESRSESWRQQKKPDPFPFERETFWSRLPTRGFLLRRRKWPRGDGLQVVIRRLPPNLSKEQLEEQLSPLPSYDYFEFFPADQRYSRDNRLCVLRFPWRATCSRLSPFSPSTVSTPTCSPGRMSISKTLKISSCSEIDSMATSSSTTRVWFLRESRAVVLK